MDKLAKDTGMNDLSAFVAGASGMVGSAIVRRLKQAGIKVLTGPERRVDLRDTDETNALINSLKPDWIFLAAAKVGGIHANNTYPADFIYDNLMIQSNVIHAAYKCGVKKLLFLGSACIYPRLCEQPIREESLLNGYLEPTNEPYAIAKIAGLTMARSYNRQYGTNYISVMPTNLYGPYDNYSLENSHVIPALLRKAHEAKKQEKHFIEVWGTGAPRREFMHVDDLADASFFLMRNYAREEVVNIGTGIDIPIKDLALLIKDVVGFKGDIRFLTDKPDGMPRRVLDVSRLKDLGWQPKIQLEQGLILTYQWFLENIDSVRK